MQEYDQDIIIRQIVAFLDDRASSDEQLSLREWLAQSEQRRLYFAQIKNIYEMSGGLPDPSVIRSDKALKKVLDRIAMQPKTFRSSAFKFWLNNGSSCDRDGARPFSTGLAIHRWWENLKYKAMRFF